MDQELCNQGVSDGGGELLQSSSGHVRSVAESISTAIRRGNEGTLRWIGRVYPKIRFEEVTGLCERIRANYNGTRGYTIIWHPEQSTGGGSSDSDGHLHIYHICPYNGSHCR